MFDWLFEKEEVQEDDWNLSCIYMDKNTIYNEWGLLPKKSTFEYLPLKRFK